MPISSSCRGKKEFKPFSNDVLALTEISAVWAYIPYLAVVASLPDRRLLSLFLAVTGAILVSILAVLGRILFKRG